MSKLWVETYARNRDIFMKLCAEMLFRFQWHIENLAQELGLGPEFFSILPLSVIKFEQTQISKYDLCMLLTSKYIELCLRMSWYF